MPFLMYRVELKGAKATAHKRLINNVPNVPCGVEICGFIGTLLGRKDVPNVPCGVEIGPLSDANIKGPVVPNVPCGVESPMLSRVRLCYKPLRFLMYRVELKVLRA